jgi:sulfur-oxidizing protein SoxY
MDMEARRLLSRRGALFAFALGMSARTVAAQPPENEDPWPSLSAQIFKDRPVQNGSALLTIDAPYRAEDAALVPLSLALSGSAAERIRSVTLVIDENPSPLAAIFTLGTVGLHSLSTRVRVDSYTNIHAVAETADGQLYAVQRFVKAAGGCSAPAAKQEADSIPLGTMRFRQFPPNQGAETREVQLMVRHPNYSGMQMDQVTRLYVPAHFITSVRIWQGDDLVLNVDSGISLSENPEFRFDLRPNGATEFRAEVRDSEGKVFKDGWPVLRA